MLKSLVVVEVVKTHVTRHILVTLTRTAPPPCLDQTVVGGTQQLIGPLRLFDIEFVNKFNIQTIHRFSCGSRRHHGKNELYDSYDDSMRIHIYIAFRFSRMMAR